jgi:hypothetical protein
MISAVSLFKSNQLKHFFDTVKLLDTHTPFIYIFKRENTNPGKIIKGHNAMVNIKPGTTSDEIIKFISKDGSHSSVHFDNIKYLKRAIAAKEVSLNDVVHIYD